MGIREEKLAQLERLRPLFNYLPFVDFALIAGSLAFGNPKETSDFDVILGCKKGRIWTARAFAIFVFGFHGVRRTSKQKGFAVSNKICLNHFVTPSNYRLREPYNEYWQKLYQNLIPFAGDAEKIKNFFIANQDWSERISKDFLVRPLADGRKKLLEILLTGPLGDWLEQFLRFTQLKKINSYVLDESKKPRVFVSDEELEFHPDTLRIEEYLRNYP